MDQQSEIHNLMIMYINNEGILKNSEFVDYLEMEKPSVLSITDTKLDGDTDSVVVGLSYLEEGLRYYGWSWNISTDRATIRI